MNKSTTERLNSLRKRYVAVSFNSSLEDEIKKLVLLEREEAIQETILKCAELTQSHEQYAAIMGLLEKKVEVEK